MTNESSPSPRAGPNPMSYTEHPAHGGAAVTSDAEPLSDAEFERKWKQVEGWFTLEDDARYHRVRVRELEAERDKLMSDLEGPMDARLAALEAERDELRRQRDQFDAKHYYTMAERDELRRQVEAARTALERISEGHAENYSRQQEIAREAIAALAPQTGEQSNPTRCMACGSADVIWQGVGEGFHCRNCNASDSDE